MLKKIAFLNFLLLSLSFYNNCTLLFLINIFHLRIYMASFGLIYYQFLKKDHILISRIYI